MAEFRYLRGNGVELVICKQSEISYPNILLISKKFRQFLFCQNSNKKHGDLYCTILLFIIHLTGGRTKTGRRQVP